MKHRLGRIAACSTATLGHPPTRGGGSRWPAGKYTTSPSVPWRAPVTVAMTRL